MNTYGTTMKVVSLIALFCMAWTSVHAFVVQMPQSARLPPLQMTVLSYNGKKKDFKPGTPLSTAVAQLGGTFVFLFFLLVIACSNSVAHLFSPTYSFHRFTRLLYETQYAASLVKPTYSCRKGDCATCQIMLAGRMTKPCVAKVPPEPTLKSLKEKGLEIRV
jgi:hypothetical protein